MTHTLLHAHTSEPPPPTHTQTNKQTQTLTVCLCVCVCLAGKMARREWVRRALIKIDGSNQREKQLARGRVGGWRRTLMLLFFLSFSFFFLFVSVLPQCEDLWYTRPQLTSCWIELLIQLLVGPGALGSVHHIQNDRKVFYEVNGILRADSLFAFFFAFTQNERPRISCFFFLIYLVPVEHELACVSSCST